MVESEHARMGHSPDPIPRADLLFPEVFNQIPEPVVVVAPPPVQSAAPPFHYPLPPLPGDEDVVVAEEEEDKKTAGPIVA